MLIIFLTILGSLINAKLYQDPSGRGAKVPYLTYEAEDGIVGGGAEVLSNSNRELGSLAGEASGRAAVRLPSSGSYVEWKVVDDANSIVCRCAMPTLAIEETRTLSVAVDGQKIGTLTLTTKHTHLCGTNSDPTKCSPGNDGFHLYDDSRLLFGTTIRSGQTIRIYKDGGDTALWYAVDFIDLELVEAPKEMPSGFLSITEFGAVEGQNCADALNKTVNAAVAQKAKGVYIPRGNWPMDNINGVQDTGKTRMPSTINSLGYKFEIMGAGMWYTRIHAVRTGTDDWGRSWAFDCQGQTIYYHDFMFDGENRVRTEGGKPFVNGYGMNTVIENVWIEHSTCGYWVGGAVIDFPIGTTQEQMQSRGLQILNCRARNTGADGMNLCAGTTNAIVENCNFRSNGDDAIAMWSERDGWVNSDQINPGGSQGNIVRFCTCELTWRANGIAIYGGRNNTVEYCFVKDIMTYHGIDVDGGTFVCSEPTGEVYIRHCTLLRTSGCFWNQVWPALGIYKNLMQQVIIDDLDVIDTFFGAMRFEGQAYARISNCRFDGFCKYTGPDPAGTWAMGFIGPFGSGRVEFYNVTQTNWGGLGYGFYANPKYLEPSMFFIGEGCNFNYNEPPRP